MSAFKIIESSVDSANKTLGAQVVVKPTDEKWKDFSGLVMRQTVFDKLEWIKNFKVLDDDIFLTGYLRSGTTMVAEMIWLIANNFDFAKATSLTKDDRIPGLEYDEQTQKIQKGKKIYTFDTLTRPRTIKTHLPVHFLPDDIWIKKPKMIYVSRDARDVAVSFYHFSAHFDNSVSMNKFFDNFINDQLFMAPYREHRLNYWNIPDYQNILYLTYESVTSDIDNAIRDVASFLGVTISDENFHKLKDHLRFDKMKNISSCNNKLMFEKMNEMTKQTTVTDDFIRRGKIGGYKDEMSNETIEKFDKWIAEEGQLKAGFPRITK